jgi:hypothetical protein
MNIAGYTQQLDANTKDLLDYTERCSAAHFLQKPAGDKWSIAEIGEHILLSERVIYMLLSRPSASKSEKPELVGNEKIAHILVSRRSVQVPSAPSLHPKGIYQDAAAFGTELVANRDKQKQELLSGRIDLNNGTHKHPVLGEMTPIDWLHFNLHHAQRHLEQMKDILASQGYSLSS